MSSISEHPDLSEAKQRLLRHCVHGGKITKLPQNRSVADQVTPNRSLSPRLRDLSLDDYAQVAELELRYGLGFKSYEQWSHIWLKNPAYQELENTWTLGWVLEDYEGRIVGAHENIPLFYEFRGRRILAAQGRGWVLEPKYRGYSLWLLMSFFEQKGVELCFDTTAGMEAAQADAALGALRVPTGSWDRDAFWITNYSGMLGSWMSRKLPRQISFLAKPLAWPLATALFLRDIPKRNLPTGQRDGYSLEFLNQFDERFDEFWHELREQSPNTLLAVRTRETLEWHFAFALLQKHVWIMTLAQGRRLAAYAIFMRTEDRSSGINQVTLIDFQTTEDPTLLLTMVSAALKRCAQERVHLLENIGLSFADSGINDAAPYKRRMPWWRYFYKARTQKLEQELSDPDVWRPSLYDGDASIL